MATTTTTTIAHEAEGPRPAAAERILDRCVESGIPDRDMARRALHATLAVLGSRLTDDEASALSSALPGELARIVDQAEYDRDFDAAELYALIAARTQATTTSLGDSREQTDVALRVIGETINDDVRRRLCRALPAAIAHRLNRPDDLREPPPHRTTTHSPQLSTLATGRPGSRHPVSESAPTEGQTHSVARSRDPHAETKLSSTHGLTQERLGETLAEGRAPSPDRTLAEANDHD